MAGLWHQERRSITAPKGLERETAEDRTRSSSPGLGATQECIERYGLSKVGLSDVASAAGVTRQTVYCYFAPADDLFNAADVLASGSFLDRMRARVVRQERLSDRIVESLVVAIEKIPKDEHLSALVRSGAPFAINSALKLLFKQDEMLASSDGDRGLCEQDRDELAQIL
jgi:AcrR family transcriptional regulator